MRAAINKIVLTVWYVDLRNAGKLINPSTLALMLLFGLLFLQAAFHLLSVSWTRAATLTFYSATGLLVFWRAWATKKSLRAFNVIDACFIAFAMVSLISLGAHGPEAEINHRLLGFLALMVVVPYVCGRCFGRSSMLPKLQHLILIAGLAIMPMLLLDRLLMPAMVRGRLPIFGMDHGPLLVGALLAATLIAAYAGLLHAQAFKTGQGRLALIAGLVFLCLMVVFLVWVSARGWLLAGVLGTLVATMAARRVALLKRVSLLVAVLLIATMSLKWLPVVDLQFGPVYSIAGKSLTTGRSIMLGEVTPVLDKAAPVLGKASCMPFDKGVDSIAMRWTLYQEAIAIFLQKPWVGVGAGMFGWYSCTGPGGFPHSTVLQVLSELGVLGGGLFAALIVLSAGTLMGRAWNARGDSERRAMTFLASLFASVLVADQIYGNGLMAAAFWLLMGIAASMHGRPRLKGGTDA